MKIGIITIQRSEVNFGACLQSYALWRYISNLGFDCEVIDLLRPCHRDYERSVAFGETPQSIRSKVKDKIRQLFLPTKKKNGLSKYRDFNNKVKYSIQYKSVDELYKSPVKYNVLVSGSDQIWNPKMPFVNEPYFLTFAPAKCKRIAYASSFGVNTVQNDVKINYKKWLSAYQHVSVREDSGAKLIEQITGKKAQVVLDPVFLITKEEWKNEMQALSEIIPQKYIFCYMLHYDEKLLKKAIDISKSKNLRLILVLSENKTIVNDDVVQLTNIGPAEWLWLINNANFMVTNSFHGSAFSIIFRTPFAVFLRKGTPTNTRIEGLLEKLNLSDHIFDIDIDLDLSEHNLGYNEKLDSALNLAISDSMNYLSNAISE